MQVRVNTDSSVDGRDELALDVNRAVEQALERFAGRITRVEVHLSDVNRSKGGDSDKRCLIEARIAGRSPLAIDHRASSLRLAVDGATRKLTRAVDNWVERRRAR